MTDPPSGPPDPPRSIRFATAPRRIEVALRGRRALLVTIAGALFFGAAAGLAGLAWRLAVLRSQHATGPNWSFPSRVFSDGVALVVGRTLPREYIVAELEAREYRRVRGRALQPGTYAVIADGFEIALRGLADEPDPEGSGGPEIVRVHITDDGRLAAVQRLGGIPGSQPPDSDHPPRLEPVMISMLFDEERVWRTWVSLERVPEPVRAAILASEDRRFDRHLGVDARATLRALVSNVRSGEVREGGSTVTQQLARGLFLGRKRNLARKLAEVPLAIGLEVLLSKDQIFEMYLNSVYWGQAHGFGVGGIAEAARWYFDTPVESLDVVQGATLAAIIPAPNVIDPFQRPELVLERRNRVLEDLVETGGLPRGAAQALRQRPLGVRRGPAPTERFPSYSGYIRDVVDDRIARNVAGGHGLSIFTTMDLAWQQAAESDLAAGIDALDGGSRRRLEGAFVGIDPTTSAVRVLVGGRDPEIGDFNRAYQARRQTGSAIKPIVYAAAFSSSQGFTPGTVVSDTLRRFGEGKWAWTPRNFDHTYHSEVTLAKALEKSLNVATANLVEIIGPSEVARLAGSLGLGRLKPVMSIGLGSNETSPLQLTNAYAAFANGGTRHTPSPVRIVMDREAQKVLGPPEEGEMVLSPGIAALMTGLLENVVRYGVSYPLRATYGFDRPVAGKTGTTDDFRDAWFLGFTPDIVAGVWIGYDRPRSIGRQAAHTALPVWARIVRRMLAGFPPTPFTADSQLEWTDVDPWTGYLADSTCAVENVPFLPGTAPLAWCHHGFDEAYENLDSLYARDTTWWAPSDTSYDAAPDTSELEPPAPAPEGPPPPEPEQPPGEEAGALSEPHGHEHAVRVLGKPRGVVLLEHQRTGRRSRRERQGRAERHELPGHPLALRGGRDDRQHPPILIEQLDRKARLEIPGTARLAADGERAFHDLTGPWAHEPDQGVRGGRGRSRDRIG